MGVLSEVADTVLVELSRADPACTEQIGIKAANLAALLQAGFDVPDGVILRTHVHAQAIGNGRDSDAASVLTEIRNELVDALASFGSGLLAVRSSSPREDLAEGSFAGQYETVLNVNGFAEVEKAVRLCWESASSPQVTTYRRERRVAAAPMAVLIQRMVDARASGVAFSANPVTGLRSEIVINAVPGLGDRLVSGEVSPDQWTVHDGRAESAGTPHQAINQSQVLAIAELTRSVETHFGVPQDVEWAIEDGRVVVLQARPITALPDPPVEPTPIDFEVEPGFWQRDPSHSPRAGYHIDLLFFPLIRRTSQRQAEEFGYLFDGLEMREFGFWPYLRMVPLGGKGRPTPPRWGMWLAARLVPSVRARVKAAATAVRTNKADRFVQRWYETWHPEQARAIAEHLSVDLRSLSDDELQRHIDSTHDLLERGMDIHSLLAGSLAIVLYDLAAVCRELLDWDLSQTLHLAQGTSYKSTEPARRLNELARMADARPALREILNQRGDDHPDLESVAPELADAFSSYLRDYGCRAVGYSVAEPTLAEMPRVFLHMIRGQLEVGYDPKRHHESSEGLRRRAAEEARHRLGPGERDRFERSLARAMRAYPVREDNEFFTISAPIALLRYAILELGERLADRGLIRERDDVRFLELERARSALSHPKSLDSIVRLREGQRAWAESNPGPAFYGDPPPGPPSFDFLPADARLPIEALLWSFEEMMALGFPPDGEAGSSLRGIPASPGQYTGPVRVVIDETDFDKLQPGDVLICPITSPAWSILFPTVGALVTDTGGVLSHSAIIAREYHIPAVVASGEATSRFMDGQIVAVDGGSGIVREVS